MTIRTIPPQVETDPWDSPDLMDLAVTVQLSVLTTFDINPGPAGDPLIGLYIGSPDRPNILLWFKGPRPIDRLIAQLEGLRREAAGEQAARAAIPAGLTIESWSDLDAWLIRRTTDFAADFGDDETAQSIGVSAQDRSRGRVAMLTEVRAGIAPMVAAERADQYRSAAEDADESTWRDDPSLGAGASVEAFRG